MAKKSKKNYTDLDRMIPHLRKEYSFAALDEKKVSANPITQFTKWFDQAVRAKESNPTAMTLATATKKGKPSARIVLLKGFSSKGFVFYTNYESAKARDIQTNPNAEIVFYWAKSERQVRLSGKLKKLSSKLSYQYFANRPRKAQLAAWASDQSCAIKSRKTLEAKMKALDQEFKNEDIPIPPFWGGYVLEPKSMEFWQGRENRLNDRVLYKKTAGRWRKTRLQP